MRRSCSECGRKKKSCDGQQPCGRCVESGSQCTYSKRRWHLAQPHQHQRQSQRLDRDGARGREVLLESTHPGALAASGMLPMKRYYTLSSSGQLAIPIMFRLSASPATGLVGMQENAFLSDFFGCVGFLPLTTKSHIREMMVKIMTAPSSLQQSAVGADCDDESSFDAIARGADWSQASERNQLPMDPSTCTFWCAIALGALAKGSPIESVSKYSELAQEALAKSYSGPADVEIAKAWVILAYLCCFMGDMVRFQEYLALSKSFLTSSIGQGSADMLPVGFAEVVKHNYATFSSCGQQWQMKSYRSKEQATPPQLNEAATEAELYLYVAQSYIVYEQILHETVTKQSAMVFNSLYEAVSDGRSDGVRGVDQVFLPQELSDGIDKMWGSVGGLSFEPLERAVDRPSVRGGIGSLLINTSLIFSKAAKGDLHAALEKMSLCLEVFEKYPGLCRSTVGCHLAHLVLVSLAAIGDCRAQPMYDKLRGCYNSFRSSRSRPIPPLDEWRGVDAFCDDVICRAMDLDGSKLKALSASLVESMESCAGTKNMVIDEGETALRGRWENQIGMISACNVAEKTLGTVAVCPTGGEAECRMGSTMVSTAPNASPASLNIPCRLLTTGLHSDHAECKVDSLVITPESFLPQMSEGSGVVEDAEEGSIGAEDWLDVTHAMLDALLTD
ncbi:unnamed protein product [Ectocarpus fasciculatus]